MRGDEGNRCWRHVHLPIFITNLPHKRTEQQSGFGGQSSTLPQATQLLYQPILLSYHHNKSIVSTFIPKKNIGRGNPGFSLLLRASRRSLHASCSIQQCDVLLLFEDGWKTVQCITFRMSATAHYIISTQRTERRRESCSALSHLMTPYRALPVQQDIHTTLPRAIHYTQPPSAIHYRVGD